MLKSRRKAYSAINSLYGLLEIPWSKCISLLYCCTVGLCTITITDGRPIRPGQFCLKLSFASARCQVHKATLEEMSSCRYLKLSLCVLWPGAPPDDRLSNERGVNYSEKNSPCVEGCSAPPLPRRLGSLPAIDRDSTALGSRRQMRLSFRYRRPWLSWTD